MQKLRTAVAALTTTLTLLCTGAAPVHAGTYTVDDSLAAIHAASVRWDVSERVLYRVALCESELEPHARGDYGHSFGLFQLNDNPDSGLLDHFHAVTGGASAYNPYSAADYFARVVAGEFADVSPSRWSCWRVLYG